MHTTKTIKKYLQHYAELETAGLAGLNTFLSEDHVWSDVVVIPACNESSRFMRPPPPASGRSLMILVINQTASASGSVELANQTLFDAVSGRFERVWGSGQAGSGLVESGLVVQDLVGQDFELILLKDARENRDILLVDKFSQGRQLPPKGGVGNARKIGADLATGLIDMGRIKSQWIRCTDADAQVPETYFSCTNGYIGSKDIAALIYPFHHGGVGKGEPGSDVVLATQLYELSLHYYVAAFRAAGSPYAFQTIGSTIAIDADHYAKVRGFPKREAGEDFYLLNKLAKSGSVLQMVEGPKCQPIKIEARLSDRVPFGTGAAVNKMTALDDVVDDYRFYDPRVFGLLGLWLQSWPVVWESKNCELQPGLFDDHAYLGLLEHKPEDHDISCLLEALRILKTDAALKHAFKQSKSLDQFIRQMHIWFDAFRSLKLIHALRDRFLPSISFSQLSGRPEYLLLLTQNADLGVCHCGVISKCKS